MAVNMARQQQPQRFPRVGDRIGIVCGPGSFPQDNAGTVTRVYADRWYDNNAEILMDDGSTRSTVGAYTQIGIGVYFLGRCGDYMPITWMDVRPDGGTLGYCIGPLANAEDDAEFQAYDDEREAAYEESVCRSYAARGQANIY